MTGEIDAVFTWVDGNDPEFLASKNLYAAQWSTRTPHGWEERSSYTGEAELRDRPVIASHAQARFRNKDELRFALRSIEQHAPWIRRIYLVTNGQVPRWLDTSNPRMVIVPHTRLFDDARCLPTFNSNAIEATIHRIPGLSDNFIYFNDDFFFGRPVTLADFVDNKGRHKLFVENERKMPRDMTDRSMIAHSWAFNHTLLNDLVQPSTARKMFAHTPQIYNKHILAEIQLAWRDHFRRTLGNRFRTAFDAAFRLLYTGYVGEGKRAILSQGDTKSFGVLTPVTAKNYVFIKAGDPTTDYRRAMSDALEIRPAFFCVNDELPDSASPAEEEMVANLTCNFLLRFFPDPSAFEKPGDVPVAVGPRADKPKIEKPSPAAASMRVPSLPIIADSTVFFRVNGPAPDVRAGWHGAEPDGVWTEGPRGKFHLHVNPASVRDGFRVSWVGRVLGAGLPGGRILKATLQLGNDLAGTRTCEYRMENDDFITLTTEAPIPPPGWDGNFVLTVERMIAPRPRDLGPSDDARMLGVFVQSLLLQPVPMTQPARDGQAVPAG